MEVDTKQLLGQFLTFLFLLRVIVHISKVILMKGFF